MKRHEFLAHLHRLTSPRSYLEIGVNDGRSLALSRTRSIAVDPSFAINVEVACDLQLVKATSDDFFARDDAVSHFPEGVVDLAFIDGMHIFEFALRDFINVERLAHPGSLVVFDDMLPRTIDEAARDRHTGPWTGDVYKVALVLERYRPDLVVVALDTSPTGLLLVAGLDPQSTVLSEKYDEIEAEFATPDPQDVPAQIRSRATAADPEKVVQEPLFTGFAARRESGQSPDFSTLRSLRGSATFVPTPHDNPPRPRRTAQKAAGPNTATRPTVVRRVKRAAKAFLDSGA